MEFEELKIEIPTEEDEEQDEDELKLPAKKYENKAGSFVTGLDVNSKEAVERRARRRKRFGDLGEKEPDNEEDNSEEKDDSCNSLPNDIPKIPQDHKIPYDYCEKQCSLEKELKGSMQEQPDIRPEALFIYGIQDMHTKDVFDYFQDFGPGSIEWIDDYSCNVVWDDEHSAARALDSLGESIETNESDTDSNDTNKSVWKAGPPCKKASGKLLMRLATKKDKKQPGAAKRSMYYLVHGYPGQSKGHKGLVSKSRKRKILQDTERARHKSSGEPDVAFIEKMEEEDEAMEVDEPAIKVVVKNDRTTESASKEVPERLRMRMHADDVNEKKPIEEKRKLKDRLQERIQPDLDHSMPKTSVDLRDRLKSRRKHGFDFMDRPSLSIEIREEQC